MAHVVLRSDPRATGLAPPGLSTSVPGSSLIRANWLPDRSSVERSCTDMTRHLTLSTASEHARNRGDEMEAASDRTRVSDGEANSSVGAHSGLQPTLASTPVWRHRLILTGKLDYRSASELEDEIECLCQEGVTNLTLDLRRLDAIDPTGATVIAFCGAACRRRGHDFAVIPGSRVIHRVLAEAGATDSLTLDRNESVVRRFSSRSSDGFFSDRSTTMIKSL
jgi:anti-anti-sigma factor